jgi:energy-coupling factor transport system substrate-specific component
MKQGQSKLFCIAVVVLAIGLNAGLSWVNESLALPFFFDSIGTAIAAVALPLFPAFLVASLTNVAMEVVYGFHGVSWPFFVCNLATLFIIRAFVERDRFGTIGDALIVSLLVALANAVLGGLIAAFVFGGVTTVGLDYLVTGLVTAGRSLASAAFWARVPVNLIDKTIAVFAAFFLAPTLARLEHRLVRSERERRSTGGPRASQ